MRWKTISKAHNYEVSDTGVIRNIKTNRVLSLWKDKSGRMLINLYTSNGRLKCKVHRLVAEAYLDDYSEDKQVDHINRISSDNHCKNLRMVTPFKNMSNKIMRVGIIEHIIYLHKQGKSPSVIRESLKHLK